MTFADRYGPRALVAGASEGIGSAFAKAVAERGVNVVLLARRHRARRVGAGLAGAPNMVAYGASKAFGMVLAEALWAELHDAGVDVLGLILGETDTPALRRLPSRRGHRDDPDAPITGAATAEGVKDRS